MFTPNRLSSVQISPVRDGRGPATSSHLRNWVAFVDRICIGYFADASAAAALACQNLCKE